MSGSQSTGDPDPGEPSTDALEEHLPSFMMPIYRRYERFDAVRQEHAPTFVYYAELLLGVVLALGFLWWLFLYLVIGS